MRRIALFPRVALAAAALVMVPAAGAAAPAAAPRPAAARAPAPAAVVDPAQGASAEAAQIESLRQRLLASQQTIATLERELAEEKNRTVALERCRAKNGKLVGIGRQLVEGYQKRWRITHKDPFQLGRRRFEFEMQALSEAVYDEGVDVTPKSPVSDTPADPAPAAPAPASAAAPAQTTAPNAPANGN